MMYCFCKYYTDVARKNMWVLQGKKYTAAPRLYTYAVRKKYTGAAR